MYCAKLIETNRLRIGALKQIVIMEVFKGQKIVSTGSISLSTILKNTDDKTNQYQTAGTEAVGMKETNAKRDGDEILFKRRVKLREQLTRV